MPAGEQSSESLVSLASFPSPSQHSAFKRSSRRPDELEDSPETGITLELRECIAGKAVHALVQVQWLCIGIETSVGERDHNDLPARAWITQVRTARDRSTCAPEQASGSRMRAGTDGFRKEFDEAGQRAGVSCWVDLSTPWLPRQY
jgi:hypothetical protein